MCAMSAYVRQSPSDDGTCETRPSEAVQTPVRALWEGILSSLQLLRPSYNAHRRQAKRVRDMSEAVYVPTEFESAHCAGPPLDIGRLIIMKQGDWICR